MRIGYLRVSTDTEAQRSALENQRQRIVSAGVDRIIEDQESGLSQSRPGYMEILELVSRKAISEIVVTRIDRLGRDAAATDALIAACALRGVAIRCLDGGTVESETPGGFLLSRITTSLAEVESRMLSLRIVSGYNAARKAGKPVRGRAPWGYRVSEDRARFEPDPTQFPQALEFIQLLKDCDMRMTRALEKWQKTHETLPFACNTSVKGWLENPVIRGGVGWLKGKTRTFSQVIWDQHQPLISHADFAIMERQFEQNRKSWGSTARLPPMLLTGLCVCGTCKMRLTYQRRRTYPSLLCKHIKCANRYKGIRETTVVEAINSALSKRNTELANIVKKEDSPAVLKLRKEIAQLEALNDPDFAGALEIKRARLAETQVINNAPDPKALEAFADPTIWAQLNRDELRELYLELLEQCVLEPSGEITVVLRL